MKSVVVSEYSRVFSANKTDNHNTEMLLYANLYTHGPLTIRYRKECVDLFVISLSERLFTMVDSCIAVM
jgi:hypothetical protein